MTKDQTRMTNEFPNDQIPVARGIGRGESENWVIEAWSLMGH